MERKLTLREVLDIEMTSLEFNPETMGIADELVEDVCIGVLFKNGHSHIITPNNTQIRRRLLQDINFYMDPEKKAKKKLQSIPWKKYRDAVIALGKLRRKREQKKFN